ncbi:uncharacterized protein T551_00184 [Pneumocystis jirovecii RU7]|uniref:Uncharacterized protein n=1 Tax=Pneumocystis jirovecii (strain RU7) TaxID=1408657 RepID=A0A0W4ZWD9_PNEJ7|nr:uncharacterized protein T551_00184 [Pneumocystis jirovecii RU7]KTW32699.1 hypothetical protein T551_00184 [Pneumocystis jirovecii RU7]
MKSTNGRISFLHYTNFALGKVPGQLFFRVQAETLQNRNLEVSPYFFCGLKFIYYLVLLSLMERQRYESWTYRL